MKLYVMCGLPGAGKTTYAKKIDAELLSSDDFRVNMFNSVMDQTHNKEIFTELYKKANELLEDKDVIIDATNTTRKSRMNILNAITTPCEKICLIIPTPVDECIKRRSEIDEQGKVVGEEVIMKFYNNFEIPYLEEGWDKIKILGENSFNLQDLMDITEAMKGFNQNTPWHIYDLFTHSLLTTTYLTEEDRYKANSSFYWAAFLHDTGKLFTKVTDEKGISHYPHHANVGTYELMSRGLHDLELLFYVNFHMRPLDWVTENSILRNAKKFGEQKVRNLMMLSRCDDKAGKEV